jgi:hypothetical protein
LAFYGYFRAVSAPKNQTDLPKIEITPKSFDFGAIEYGKAVEHNFTVKNLGKAVLEIKRVATSCACTKAKINKKEIQPGEEANLRVSYNSGAMSGPRGKGRQERIIYVKSSDPESPQAEVTIKAYVK